MPAKAIVTIRLATTIRMKGKWIAVLQRLWCGKAAVRSDGGALGYLNLGGLMW
jgi:hypothetical protein